jgi:hypothetical protein
MTLVCVSCLHNVPCLDNGNTATCIPCYGVALHPYERLQLTSTSSQEMSMSMNWNGDVLIIYIYIYFDVRTNPRG